jgi:hypothetical protein
VIFQSGRCVVDILQSVKQNRNTRLKHLCCGICEDDGNLEIQVLALKILKGVSQLFNLYFSKHNFGAFQVASRSGSNLTLCLVSVRDIRAKCGFCGKVLCSWP